VLPQTPSSPKLNANNTYLVVGGLGGLGRAIIRFLSTLGAKHIATLSRSGAESGSKKAFVKEMSDAGVNLTVHQGSVVNIEDIRKVKEQTRSRSIRGVVHGAMVLQVSLPRASGCWLIRSDEST
jgi:NAD(P)-dependent dehydrogenase (short-subunit alcohol dehydrogenase family)